MKKGAKIFIAGDKSITGAALINYFESNGFKDIFGDSAYGLDLTNQNTVFSFFKKEKPEYVFFTHVMSGGIAANIKYPADFFYNSLQIQTNIIHYSYEFGVKKLLFLGSSCIYPKDSPQPINEKYFLSGRLEETSEPYAIAKIAGIAMCQSYYRQYGANYISVIPATIYGLGDHFDLETSHVMSSLIMKFHQAKVNDEKRVTVWGTGKSRREFIYIDDMVDACIFLMGNYNAPEIINIGCGEDITIKELALLIKDITGFKGEIIYNAAKPDGVKQKLLDSSKMASLGWRAKTSLKDGIKITYNWFKKHKKCKQN